ncbi:MAG: hypothetical protein JNN30_04850 [Rhodanobacteraceae bacterium]|nr:hypothetical protein [Rhodanobacteraceae bacterium]
MKRFVASCLFALSVLVPLESVKAAEGGAEVPAMSEQDKDDIRYLREHLKPGAPYRLDLTNPIHYRYVTSALRRSGQSAERSPYFYKLLRAASEAKGGDRNAKPQLAIVTAADGSPTPQPLNFINILTLQSSPGTFLANGVSSVEGGTARTVVVMELYTTADMQVYKSDSGATSTAGNYFQEPVNGTVPATQPVKTTAAVGLFQYVPVGSNQIVSVVYRTDDTVNPAAACMLAPNYCVRNGVNCNPGQYQPTCTNNVANTTPIKVCYYRGSQQECDYYNQAPAHPTNFVFPVQGNAQFANNVVNPVSGTVVLTLLNPNKGGGCYLNLNGQPPPALITSANWSASGTTVNWNYGAAAFPDPTGCLEYYNQTCTIMTMQGSVALQGSVSPPTPPGFGSFTFTSDRSQIGQPGVYIIPPIEIQQGCFSSGTRIRMADGGERHVDSFLAAPDEIVRSHSGKGRKVTTTTSGIEPKPMIRIRTERGHELLVTSTHPIVTTQGARMAGELKPGMRVLTEDGDAALVAVSTERFTGKVYNLRVEAEAAAPLEQSAVYANGILAGDIRGQLLMERAAQAKLNDPAEVRKRIAPEWREDYERGLKAEGGKQQQAAAESQCSGS